MVPLEEFPDSKTLAIVLNEDMVTSTTSPSWKEMGSFPPSLMD